MSATILGLLQKICSRCKETKVLLEFNRYKARKDGLQSWCKKCQRKKAKEIYYKDIERIRRLARERRRRNIGKYRERAKQENREHPERVRKYRLKYCYGLAVDDYQALYNKQNGHCVICGRFCVVLHVDHNHETRKIRGLLCPSCNHGLGYLKNIANLRNAKNYLESHLVNVVVTT